MRTAFFILTAISVPWLPSGATVPRWAALSIICAIMIYRVELTWDVWLLIGYVGVMAYVGPVAYEAAFLYWHFLLLVVLFCYARQYDIIESATIGCTAALWLNSAVVVAQFFGLQWFPQVTPFSGLFFNHNLGSEAAGICMAMLLHRGRWGWALGLLPTLLLGSRAPISALGFAFLPMLWRRDPFQAIMACLGCQLLTVAQWAQPWGAWHDPQTGLNQSFVYTVGVARFGVWIDLIPHLNLFGHGLGSFLVDFPQYQAHSNSVTLRYESPHNDILQILYEFGIGGLVGIAVVAARLWRIKPDAAWYGLLVFAIEGLVGFPLYDPVTGALGAVCAGSLFSRRAALRQPVGVVRHRIQARLADYAAASFSGVEPPVSADPVAPIGTGLFRHPDGRFVPNR